MKMVFVSGGNGKEDAPSQGGCGGNGKDPTIVYYDATVKTNTDRIRSMTDEELAEFLSNLSSSGCDYAECPARHGCEAFSNKTCKEQMGKWLKQEATE